MTVPKVPIKILDQKQTLALINLAELFDVVEAAYVAQAQGRASPSQYINIKVNGNLVHYKSGFIENSKCFAIKYSGGFFGNQGTNAPVDPGYVIAHDSKTGMPTIMFLDDGAITNYRTAAAGGVVVRHFAVDASRTIGVIGTGLQARLQVEAALIARSKVTTVKVWGRSAEKATQHAADMCGRFPTVEFKVCREPREAVEKSDILITATASCAAIVRAEWLSPGTLIVAMGACAPDMQEHAPEVLLRADKIFADSVERCARDGDIHHALASKVIQEADISGEIGAVIDKQTPGRTSDDEIIFVDMVGLGILDAAVAEHLSEKIRAGGK